MSRMERRGWAALIVAVMGLCAVFADPGEGILLFENILVRPYVSLELAYDSNVYLEREARDDIFWGLRYGVKASRPFKSASLDLHVWALSKVYSEFTDRSETDWAEELALKFTLLDRMDMRITQDYTKGAEDKNFFTDFLADIQHLTGAMEGSMQLGEKGVLNTAYSFASGTYNPTNDVTMFDWQRQDLRAAFGYKVTDATTLFLSGAMTWLDGDGLSEPSTVFDPTIAAAMDLSDSTDLELRFGFLNQSGGPNMSAPDLGGTLSWRVTPRMILRGIFRTAINPAVQYEDNYMLIHNAHLRTTMQIAEAVWLKAWLGYQRNSYERPIEFPDGTMQKLEENFIPFGVYAEYTIPRKFLGLFAQAECTMKQSPILENEFERYKLSIGVRAEY